MSIDDILFTSKPLPVIVHENEENMAKKKEEKYVSPSAGLDVGTGWLVGSSYISTTKIDYIPLRDCFYTIPTEMFSKSMFNKDKVKYVEHDGRIHIVGEDALTLAKIQNGVAQRPMAKGVINPNERSSAPILREMIRYCIETNPIQKGGKVVFSVPAAVIGSDDNFNVEYHELSISSLISSLGYTPEPLNEAYAVIISEMENADEVTGLGLSFGAGLVNVAMAYKGMKLFEFSINKSGDFIDKESSRACGIGESIMNHIKERQLDLTKNEFEVDAEQRALIFVHKHVIKNVIDNIIRTFSKSDSVNIIEPIPVIISGGTTLPNGFVELFEKELLNAKLPFKVTEVIPAKDRLTAVAHGCLLWSMR